MVSPTIGRLKENGMERRGNEVHVSEIEASAGTQPHIVRYVLGISLLLAVGLLSLVWIVGSMTR